MPALTLKIIIASTRPGRSGPAVANWVHEIAADATDFNVELVDLAELNLPLLDEPGHPRLKNYEHDHTRRWSAIVEDADALVFVTPEYDFFPPASIINAVQCLFTEWDRKPAGVVSYGGVSGGLRAAQVLRQLLGNLGVVPLKQAVPIPFFSAHIEDGRFTPSEQMLEGAKLMLSELTSWAEMLAPARERKAMAAS